MVTKMTNDHFLNARKKITEIANETILPGSYDTYFKRTASFLELVLNQYDFVASGDIYKADIEELAKRNKAIFSDILPENYANSYANPAYAAECLNEFGKILSFLYTELRCLIMYAHEMRINIMIIRMEFFIKIYDAFINARNGMPKYEEIHKIVYHYVTENLKTAALEKQSRQFTPKNDFAKRIIMESDLTDLRYLYYFGEYITENELEIAKHLNSLPDEKIKLMADTYTEGFRKGFELMGRDIKKKKVVAIRYELGFERMVRNAVFNFSGQGLESIFSRINISVLDGRGANRFGYFGAYANKQYEYDHKDDLTLVWDQDLNAHRLSALEKAFEEIKGEVKDYAGLALMTSFGAVPFSPQYKDEALHPSADQQKRMAEYLQDAGELMNRYVPSDETSYTIIAFPTPEIGSRFSEIFDETIALNTLDYNLYQDIQQIIIDALDQAEYVKVTGRGENKTDLRVAIGELTDPVGQTNFENCVADVNIPVGEVFTSPQLKGTNGTLHVTRVFLNGMEYKDLTLQLEDGMITDYSCANFEKIEENKKFIRENVLSHYDSLPVSEFAIGTNTTAYMVGRKYDIFDRFPILIAEKTGPHFAFGDTCYAHSEDIAVFNPDGKEIVARDNEISLKRKLGNKDAYFNCHIDITIPYDELGEITAQTKSGSEITIFSGSKFVLPGCEALNDALTSVIVHV